MSVKLEESLEISVRTLGTCLGRFPGDGVVRTDWGGTHVWLSWKPTLRREVSGCDRILPS